MSTLEDVRPGGGVDWTRFLPPDRTTSNFPHDEAKKSSE